MFVTKLGKSSLGLSYGMALTDLILAPATPSNTARSGGAIALFAPAGVPSRLFGLIALAALALPPARAVEQGFRMTVLDVGQGLAVIVQTREHTLLFDAGPAWPGGFDAGRSVVAPFLLRKGIRRIDRLIASHGDRDHVGGITVLNDLTAREIQKQEVVSGTKFWVSKNMPGFTPVGPYAVPLAEIAGLLGDSLRVTEDHHAGSRPNKANPLGTVRWSRRGGK